MNTLPERDPPRLRLDYLDGVRAVAAIYVSLFHALLTAVYPNPYAPPSAPLAG